MERDDGIREKLAASAGKLDAAKPQVPGFQYFKGMVEKQRAAARRSQRRQFALFVAVAALIVSAIVVCTGSYPALIVALQGAAAAGSLVALAVFYIKNRVHRAGAAG